MNSIYRLVVLIPSQVKQLMQATTALRNLAGLGLREAYDCLEKRPCTAEFKRHSLPRTDLVDELRAYGITVTVDVTTRGSKDRPSLSDFGDSLFLLEVVFTPSVNTSLVIFDSGKAGNVPAHVSSLVSYFESWQPAVASKDQVRLASLADWSQVFNDTSAAQATQAYDTKVRLEARGFLVRKVFLTPNLIKEG